MNIDTSTLTPANEKNNYIAAYQNSVAKGDEAFKFQMESLSGKTTTSKLEKTESDSETEAASEVKQSDKDETEDTKVTSKSDDNKTSKSEQQKDTQIKNDESEQNQSNQQQGQQNPQNQQNQQSSMLSDEIAEMLRVNTKNGTVNNIQNINFKTGISEDVYTSVPAIDYSRFSMSEGDALFFANLVTKTDMSMQSIAGGFQKSLNTANVQSVEKTAKVSSVLMDALVDSMNNNKSFRIDFDKDVSVVMRVDKDGLLNANFIPGDKAVEAYLRNNISYLRQRFDDENLPYNELTYSKYKQQDQDSEKRKDKEKDNE